MNRKEFLRISFSGSGAFLFNPEIKFGDRNNKVRFGIISDLHHDIMHDSISRLESFVGEMSSVKVDFIIQLGDFCIPEEKNRNIMNVWNQFSGNKYHVIGNHDMDGGHNRDEVVKYWEMDNRYYSFDQGGFHFIILDGNDENPSPDRPKGYARFISNKQLDWLSRDLDNTNLPTIVFCHQGMDNDAGGLENGTLVRYVLESANQRAGFEKVILVFSGHHHQDYYNQINGIHYVQINSASYKWLGDEYKHIRYSREVDEDYPWIKYTLPYKDPIWASVTLDSGGNIDIEGKETEFVGPSPEDMNIPKLKYIYPIESYISDRSIKYKKS